MTPEDKARIQRKRDQAFTTPVMVGLVRDGKTGEPKIDGSLKNLPHDVKEAYRKLLTPAEAKRYL